MSFNPQDFIDSLGRLRGNNSAQVSVIQQASQLMQQPATAINANINTGRDSSAGATSSSSILNVAQIQALLAARAPQQTLDNQGFSFSAYGMGASSQPSNKEDIQQTLATILVKQKLQQAQSQSRGLEFSGTCSLASSASASTADEGNPSPLQQMLRKIIRGNNVNLQQEQNGRTSIEDLQDKLLWFANQQQQQQRQQQPAVQGLQGLCDAAPVAAAASAPDQSHCNKNLATILLDLQQEKSQPDTLAVLSSLQNTLNVPTPASLPQAVPSSVSEEAEEPAAVPEKKRRRGRSGSFPQKIHQMLRDLEEQGRQDIASFVRDGTAFCIHRPKEFAKEVMPKYFKMGSYASFQRQLNLYNFIRIAEGPERGSYHHKLFLQGKPLLSTTMKRKEAKKPAPKSAKAPPQARDQGME